MLVCVMRGWFTKRGRCLDHRVKLTYDELLFMEYLIHSTDCLVDFEGYMSPPCLWGVHYSDCQPSARRLLLLSAKLQIASNLCRQAPHRSALQSPQLNCPLKDIMLRTEWYWRKGNQETTEKRRIRQGYDGRVFRQISVETSNFPGFWFGWVRVQWL